MSIRAMSAGPATVTRPARPDPKAMADYANDDDNTCWPRSHHCGQGAPQRAPGASHPAVVRGRRRDCRRRRISVKTRKPITIHQINVAALTKSDAGKGDILSDKDDILSLLWRG